VDARQGSYRLLPLAAEASVPHHFILPGFMSQEERKKFESLKSDFNKYWVPCVWFTNLAAQARRDGRIRDDIALCLLLEVSHPGIRPLGTSSL
jgi:hypothetical protein